MSTTVQFDTFAIDAWNASCMNVACAGGDLSYIIIWYWTIPSLYPVFHNIYGAQFAFNNNAHVVIANHPGCHADGYAGVDAESNDHDLNEEFEDMGSSSFCSRSMGATRKLWDNAMMDFDDDLIEWSTIVDIAWVLAKEKGGDP